MLALLTGSNGRVFIHLGLRLDGDLGDGQIFVLSIGKWGQVYTGRLASRSIISSRVKESIGRSSSGTGDGLRGTMSSA